MFTRILGADGFAPQSLGTQTVLLAHDRIANIGAIDRRALDALGLPVETVDASGCIVTPGFIDEGSNRRIRLDGSKAD